VSTPSATPNPEAPTTTIAPTTPAPPAVAAVTPAPRTGDLPPTERVPPSHSLGTHVRAAVLFVVLSILVTGFAYPIVVTEIAQVIDPSAANGSLLYYPNGTLAGSALVAQNTDAPYLFWERPSLTDYNMTLGAPTPYGPSDPALVNETLVYMAQYGYSTVNASVPFWLVSASGSSIDPDLTPEAVLVQIPRVAGNTSLTEAQLLTFVNAHIVNPTVPFVGVAYVNVLELDLALLPMIGR
jgi:potassium-transporting ATPase KdpC subunit